MAFGILVLFWLPARGCDHQITVGILSSKLVSTEAFSAHQMIFRSRPTWTWPTSSAPSRISNPWSSCCAVACSIAPRLGGNQPAQLRPPSQTSRMLLSPDPLNVDLLASPLGPTDPQPFLSLSAGQGQAGAAAEEEHDAPAQGPQCKKIETRRDGSHRSTSDRVSSSSEHPCAPSGRASGSSQRASGPSKGASGSSKGASGSSKRSSKGASGPSGQTSGPSKLPQHSHPSALQTDAQQSPSAHLLKRRAQKNTDHAGPLHHFFCIGPCPISNVKIINFVPSKTNAEITLAITFEQASAAQNLPDLLLHPARDPESNQAPFPHPSASEQDQLSLETEPSSETQPGSLSNSGKTAQSSCYSDSCPKGNRQTVLKAMYDEAMSRLTCSSAVQEVKECYQDLITHAANLFKSDLGNSLPVITQRLDNKITKFASFLGKNNQTFKKACLECSSTTYHTRCCPNLSFLPASND
ncbi:hypothetical protein PCASD_22622 [Puccinia coronata f. sp. avenae]|uniref:Uncharacterized protein n=1 Tax=Puccinia coronata f. sp. avenae TaxID=200324 RepID=A0A2N5S9F5_9BASI|nr:hypothetical protein PCASD_22622 [Puccinia coronata f. sp. avenae]